MEFRSPEHERGALVVENGYEHDDRINVAREIARKLRLNYVFGREFVELTQGSKPNPAYHGQATLSRWKISSPRVIHFRQQSNFWKPHWYLPKMEPFQERLGGRIALATKIDIADVPLTSYNLHLESRANDELRLTQLEDVLRDALTCGPPQPIVPAGDLNLNTSKPTVAEVLSRAGFRDQPLVCPPPLRATCWTLAATSIGRS